MFQRVVICCKRGCLPAGVILDSGSLTPGQNLLQGSQRIQRTGKTGIGIQLRKRFLGFADSQAIIQRFGRCLLQAGLVAFGFQSRNDGKSLPTGGKCNIHSLCGFFALRIPDQRIEHPYLAAAEFVFLPQGSRFCSIAASSMNFRCASTFQAILIRLMMMRSLFILFGCMFPDAAGFDVGHPSCKVRKIFPKWGLSLSDCFDFCGKGSRIPAADRYQYFRRF